MSSGGPGELPAGMEPDTTAAGITSSTMPTDLSTSMGPSTSSTQALGHDTELGTENHQPVSSVDDMLQLAMDDPVSSLPYISPFELFTGGSSTELGAYGHPPEGNASILPNTGYHSSIYPDLFTPTDGWANSHSHVDYDTAAAQTTYLEGSPGEQV